MTSLKTTLKEIILKLWDTEVYDNLNIRVFFSVCMLISIINVKHNLILSVLVNVFDSFALKLYFKKLLLPCILSIFLTILFHLKFLYSKTKIF